MNLPVVLVPATPEMLFGSGVNDEEVESEDDYEYEEDDEVEETSEGTKDSSSTPANASLNWETSSRIIDLDDQEQALQR